MFWSRPYLLLTLAVATWGGNTIAGRLAVGEVSPMAIVCLRWLIVVVVMVPFVRAGFMAEIGPLAGRWRYLFLMGALGYTAFNALFYWSAQYTSAVNMGVIQGTAPAIVLLGSLAVYGTRVRALQVVGLVATLIGVAVTASHGDIATLRTFAFNIGDLGILAASALYGGYTVGLRSRPAVAPLVFFTAMAASALVTSLPLLAAEVASGNVIWPSPKGWAIVLFIALLPSLASQLLYMRGVELIGPARAGLFMNLIPVFSALGGVLILGETFAPYHALAFVLVLGGIWLSERRAG